MHPTETSATLATYERNRRNTRTMTQTEHLHLIRARCMELLEIAEKRTAGAWIVVPFGNYDEYKLEPEIFTGEPVASTGMTPEDATFVASCAGAAEAGWRATVAMIDCTILILACLDGCENHPLQARELETAKHFAFELISAWPIELLSNK